MLSTQVSKITLYVFHMKRAITLTDDNKVRDGYADEAMDVVKAAPYVGAKIFLTSSSGDASSTEARFNEKTTKLLNLVNEHMAKIGTAELRKEEEQTASPDISYSINNNSTVSFFATYQDDNENNEVIETVAPVENDVVEWDNKQYALFHSIQTSRKHETLCKYADHSYIVPGLIELESLKVFIQDFLNLCQTFIVTNRIKPTKTLLESLLSFRDSLSAQTPNSLKSFRQIAEQLIDALPMESLLSGFQNGSRRVVSLDFEHCTYGKMLSILNLFMVNFLTFDESLIDVHSTGISSFVIVSLFRWILADLTHLEKSVPVKRAERSQHYFGCFLVDSFTDRNGLELFIKERKLQAANTLKYYRKRYPQILQIYDTIAQIPRECLYELAQESIQLNPYIFFYHQKDEHRVANTWKNFGLYPDFDGDYCVKVFEKLTETLNEQGFYSAENLVLVVGVIQGMMLKREEHLKAAGMVLPKSTN